MRDFIQDSPYQVDISLQPEQYSAMVEWLGERGLQPREKVFFGGLGKGRVDSVFYQSIHFAHKNDALIFKLTWGGDQ